MNEFEERWHLALMFRVSKLYLRQTHSNHKSGNGEERTRLGTSSNVLSITQRSWAKRWVLDAPRINLVLDASFEYFWNVMILVDTRFEYHHVSSTGMIDHVINRPSSINKSSILSYHREQTGRLIPLGLLWRRQMHARRHRLTTRRKKLENFTVNLKTL